MTWQVTGTRHLIDADSYSTTIQIPTFRVEAASELEARAKAYDICGGEGTVCICVVEIS